MSAKSGGVGKVGRCGVRCLCAGQHDFEAEYIHTKHGAREIDELGEHMNELSGALEHTISELKIANNELKRDIKKKEEMVLKKNFRC